MTENLDTSPFGVNINRPDIELPDRNKWQIDLSEVHEDDILLLRDTDEVVHAAHTAIQAIYPESVFTDPFGTRLLVIQSGRLTEVDETEMKALISGSMVIREPKIKMKNKRPVLVMEKLPTLPKAYIDIMLSNSEPQYFKQYDVIRQVRTHPFLLDKALISSPGYHKASQVYIINECPQIELSAEVSEVEATDALLIIDDLIQDFGFHDKHSRANYLGYLLSFGLRELFEQRIPIFCVKGRKQEGKGKLINIANHIWNGRGARMVHIKKNNWGSMNTEEFEKLLTGILLAQDPDACIDNVECEIESDLLASSVAETDGTVRRLRQSELTDVVFDTIFSMTGDKIEFGEHISSRYYITELASDTDRPSMNRNFKYPQILRTVKENRTKYLKALLTIIKYWVDIGCPTADIKWESFPEFAQITGGVLKAIGVKGFLSNLDDTLTDETTDANAALAQAIYEQFNTEPFTVNDIIEIATYRDGVDPSQIDDENQNVLGDILTSKDYTKRLNDLRYHLKSLGSGRVCGTYRIAKYPKKIRRANAYYLMVLGSSEEDAYLNKRG